MRFSPIRRTLMTSAVAASLALAAGGAFAQSKIKLRLSSPASPTDQRAVAMTSVFAPAVASFAELDPHWNASLFKQGTELEAISRGNLEMSIASAQELAEFFPSSVCFLRVMCTATPPTKCGCSTPTSSSPTSKKWKTSWA